MEIYNFTRKKGDTSEDIIFELFSETTNQPIDLTGSTICLQFRFGSSDGQIKVELNLGSGLTMIDPLLGKFAMNEIDKLDWDLGVYYYDVEIVLGDGRTKTYVGGVMKVGTTTTKKTA